MSDPECTFVWIRILKKHEKIGKKIRNKRYGGKRRRRR
jgi:hypothetical protein